MGWVLVRALVALGLVWSGTRAPLSGQPTTGIAAGIVLVALAFFAEHRLRSVPGTRLAGGVVGLTVGVAVGRTLAEPFEGQWAALQGPIVLVVAYFGFSLGARRDWLDPRRLLATFREAPRAHRYKILDTSVIIDGRIADICETGFVEGTLVTPEFVLRELQQVADSSDSLKRNRGRRGLDILQKIQKMSGVTVEIVETDFPHVREVDLKLIELAREMNAKIVTNDFNLNKVAQLRGVQVLNINELANSLKPVVLPGEMMRVFMLKEGKEAGQGVGYLDDGTMVVVDQGRQALGTTIEVAVTSVLQTTAGKMIFCRRPDAVSDVPTNGRRERRSRGSRRDADHARERAGSSPASERGAPMSPTESRSAHKPE